MKTFIHDDFLLNNETAKTLYHEYAKDMPNGVGAMVTMVPGDFEGLPESEELKTLMESADFEDVAR